jgi:hypothetical protein
LVDFVVLVVKVTNFYACCCKLINTKLRLRIVEVCCAFFYFLFVPYIQDLRINLLERAIKLFDFMALATKYSSN